MDRRNFARIERIGEAVGAVGLRRLAAYLTISAAGVTGIAAHEGTVQKVYLDPVGIPTVCTGHVTTAKVGTVFTLAQCADLLRQDTKLAQAAVSNAVVVPVTQEQFDSLVSLTFNIGSTNFRTSTLLRKLNANDCLGAAAEFSRWTRARGVVLPGLVKRRADERQAFEAGCR